ncbi:hypothetical protein TNCV_2465881 [Trichonephila clavipes]|uniref:Uncharacterized protein n=1 Tax=Trichonephila clavipes TaxID=2585209 RepID=A0A8X6R3Y7_TRICX|nr:hypothetical protein TNCV_2465881 [Trichonephila clavipes]
MQIISIIVHITANGSATCKPYIRGEQIGDLKKICTGPNPPPPRGGGVRYATAMYIYTLPDALFVCYKQSPDNPCSVASSQRASSPRWIEDDTFNGRDIINHWEVYEDGQLIDGPGIIESG